jgi:predicted nucleic acid-binding protein
VTVVVDASLAGAWVLKDEQSEEAEDLLAAIVEGREDLAAPDLWSYEMLNLLIAACRRGRLRQSQLQDALRLLEAVPCAFYEHQFVLTRERIAKLALRFSLSAHDASYLELADRLQCALKSSDRALLKAAASMGLAPISHTGS